MAVSRTPRARIILDELQRVTLEGTRSSGKVCCDADELSALREAARAHVLSMFTVSFGDSLASDRDLVLQKDASQKAINSLVAKREVQWTRLTQLRESTQRIPAPRQSLAVLVAGAIGVLVICFAPTLYSVFFVGIDDSVIAWAISIGIGAAMGGFLCMLLLNFEEAPCR